jgi:polyhydroxybutyrate depolymerase
MSQMLRPRSARLALTVLVGLLGCVPAQPGLDPGSTTPTPAGTGGKAAGESGAGAAGEGGRTGTGGSASGGAASGGAAAGGASGGSGGSTGGAQGTAGASGTGGAAGEPGTGGAPGDAGAEGGAAPAPAAGAKPSAGCGKKDPPSGSRMFMTQGRTTPYIVSLPPAYNAETPYPLAFALHGFGRDHEACRRSDCPNVQMVMGDKAILVFMKSIGAGWETDTRTQNLQYFGELLTAMKNEYCVDENRVLVAGTSSGAAFTNILGCKYGDQLRLVSPVAGPADNVGCKGNPAAIVIHGISDGVARGENARNLYAQRNGCTMTTVPPLAEVRTKISAARAARRGEIACASYQGCMKAPVRWCEHSFGGYDNSTHGWPPPGAQLIWDLMNELK